jgi:hypothetical protein
MATVNRAFVSWTATGAYFAPGATHSWWVTSGFKYGDAMSVTAHPVTGDPAALHRVLAVESVRIDGDPGGRTLRFTVHNVGSYEIPGYGIGISYISA